MVFSGSAAIPAQSGSGSGSRSRSRQAARRVAIPPRPSAPEVTTPKGHYEPLGARAYLAGSSPTAPAVHCANSAAPITPGAHRANSVAPTAPSVHCAKAAGRGWSPSGGREGNCRARREGQREKAQAGAQTGPTVGKRPSLSAVTPERVSDLSRPSCVKLMSPKSGSSTLAVAGFCLHPASTGFCHYSGLPNNPHSVVLCAPATC